MDEGIDISSGGAIAVDTEVIRALIPRITDAADRLSSSARELGAVAASATSRISFGIGDTRPLVRLPVPGEGIRRQLRERSERMRETAAYVRLMAEAYEIVEARQATRLADAAGYSYIGRTAEQSQGASPEALAFADELEKRWRAQDDLAYAQFTQAAFRLGGPVAGVTVLATMLGLSGALGRVGRGAIPAGRRLSGERPEVSITVTQVTERVEAPDGLAEAVRRLPKGEAQVRVETYSFPDGHEEHLVHIAGTRALAGENPWNLDSNLRLYFDQFAGSYEAVRQALEAAGAQPGDIVHTNGHSQGAMVGAAVATEGEYDVRTGIGSGSPVAAVLHDSVLSIQLTHPDDPVAMLADGGLAARTGSPDSVVVRRVIDPASGVRDLAGYAHLTSHYEETARLFDESGDPRVAAVDALWAHLRSADSVRAIDVVARVATVEVPDAKGGDLAG